MEPTPVRDYLLSILFGVIEGLTEFLPVSSTAHLRLIKPLLGVSLESEFWKMYDVVIQLGAILAVVVYFRTRIFKFVRTFPKGESGDRSLLTHPLSLVMLAFFVTAIPIGLGLTDIIKDNLESLALMGWALLIGGVAMWVIDAKLGKGAPESEMEKATPLQAAIVGAVQILAAVFPGTSRSMSTIAGGQLAGMSRVTALEFSFFLAIPTMFAACLFDLKDSIESGAVVMTGHLWGVTAVGFVVSFFVAWLVIAWFMGWVKKRGFVPFAIYRIILGVVVLIGVYAGWFTA